MKHHTANELVKYLKTIRTQPYKALSVKDDTEFGSVVCLHDLHTDEFIWWGEASQRSYKSMRQELRTVNENYYIENFHLKYKVSI